MLSLWPSLTLCIFCCCLPYDEACIFGALFSIVGICVKCIIFAYGSVLNAFQLVFFTGVCVFEFFGKKKIFREKINWFVFFVWCYFLLLDWGLFLVFFPRIVFIVSHDLEKIIWLPIICLELFPPSMNIIWNLTGWEGESVEWWFLISCISSEWV